MSQTMYKLGIVEPQDCPWSNPPGWAVEALKGTERLVIAPPSQGIDLVRSLLRTIPEPMWLLYILFIPRGGGEAGRYQSPQPMSRAEATDFLSNFEDFLEKDGRHDLWIRSAGTTAMLVYDRHNLLYAYGPIQSLISVLTELEIPEVSSEAIAGPNPHSHHYHAAFDQEEYRLITYLNWDRTPLLEQDER